MMMGVKHEVIKVFLTELEGREPLQEFLYKIKEFGTVTVKKKWEGD
jgi:hypothetical protein